MSQLKSKKVKTKRRPYKKKYLEKFVMLEGSGFAQDPYKVLSRVLKLLWDHQKGAELFISKTKKALLAMETGTGKTLTILANLARRHARGSVDFVVIVCPASAVYVWTTEIKKWLDGTTIRFAIVSFDFARFYFKYLRKENIDALIIDESHKLKNPNSSQSSRIWRVSVNVPVKYALTGTPIADTVIDLFGQYRVVDPSILGDHWPTFREIYLKRTGYMGLQLGISEEKKKLVLKKVAPITYQVLKTVLKIEITPPTVYYCELKGTQKKLYNDISRDLVAYHKNFTVTTDRVVTQMLRLQQITGGHVPSDDEDKLVFECGKGDLLKEFLTAWDRKKKLVIFARFIHELELIQAVCTRMKYTSYVYNPKEAYIDDKFEKELHPQVSISQISRGGTARTLVRSSTPLFFSKTFSYIDYVQALGRVYRGGQTETVTPIFFSTRGTIDEDIDDIVVGEKKSESDFVKRFFERNKLKNNRD